MARRDDIFSVSSERIILGQSLGVVGLTSIAGQAAVTFKLLAGGTLEIGGQSQTHGTMYPLSSNEVMSLDCAGKFWLYSSGATCTIALLRGRTAGFE